MKSLCGLSLWMKDCRAETGFQRDRRRGREGGRKTQKVKYNNWVIQGVCGDYKVDEKDKKTQFLFCLYFSKSILFNSFI